MEFLLSPGAPENVHSQCVTVMGKDPKADVTFRKLVIKSLISMEHLMVHSDFIAVHCSTSENASLSTTTLHVAKICARNVGSHT